MVNETLETIKNEVSRRFMDIPFGNSTFQVDNFVVNASITPERAYRALGLNITSGLAALRDNRKKLLLLKIDEEELEFDLNYHSDKFSTFDIRRKKIELQSIKEEIALSEKLFKDKFMEVTHMYDLIQKFPEYTREEFEAGERDHFLIRSQNGLQQLPEPAKDLISMGLTMNDKGKLVPVETLIGALEKGLLEHKE